MLKCRTHATLLITTSLTVIGTSAFAIGVTPSSDATGLANTLFLNVPGLQVIGAQIVSGEFGQFGTYTNASGTYGLPNTGIVLSSGNVADYADGPNTDTGFTTDFGNSATEVQDGRLQPITGLPNHFDPAQLNISFNVGENISQVSFFGAFGSEEFPEFVGDTVTDGFGLFVNGTNVAGVQPTGGGANLPVNIDHPDMTAIAGTELDGILAPNGNPVLRFDVPVNPGQINDFEIIIADAGDNVLDTTAYLSSFIAQGNPGDGGGPPPNGDGSSEFNPILPSNPPDPDTGEFVIELPEPVPGETIWVDPPVTVGYEYELIGGAPALFTEVTAPSLATVPDTDGYTITVGGVDMALPAGATIDILAAFGVTPGSFTLSGIDPALGLDPENPLAFPIGIFYDGWEPGTTLSMTPLTVDVDTPAPIPLPGGLPLYLGGMAFAALFLRRRAVAH